MPAKLPSAGERFGPYRVVRVDSGARGPRIVGVDEQLDRAVTLELVDLEETEAGAVERLCLEARALAKLESEHAARLFEVGTVDGWFFVARESLEGESLAARVGSPMPLDQAARFVLQAAEVVAEAHANGVVLRALEPSHFVVARPLGGRERVKLVDFGTAKLLRDHRSGVEVTVSSALGISPYASPELVRRARHFDARSDVWSLGAILYALVAGRPPFEGDTGDLMLAILKEPHAPASSRVPALPRALDDSVLRWALAKDPDGRFRDLNAFAHALAPFAPPDAAPLIERIAVLVKRAKKPSPVRPAVAPAEPLRPRAPVAPREPVKSREEAAPTIEDELSETRIEPLQPRGEALVAVPVFAGAAADIRPTPVPEGPPFPKSEADEAPAAGALAEKAAPEPIIVPRPPPVPVLHVPEERRSSRPPLLPARSPYPSEPPAAEGVAAPIHRGAGAARAPVLRSAPPANRAERPTPIWVYAAAAVCVVTPTALAVALLRRPPPADAELAASPPAETASLEPASTPLAHPATTSIGTAATVPPSEPAAAHSAAASSTASEPLAVAKTKGTPAGPPTGTLVVVVVGGTCTFSVDGTVRGRGSTLKLVVPVGTHVIGCQSARGSQTTRTVNVRAGAASMTTFRLQ